MINIQNHKPDSVAKATPMKPIDSWTNLRETTISFYNNSVESSLSQIMAQEVTFHVENKCTNCSKHLIQDNKSSKANFKSSQKLTS